MVVMLDVAKFVGDYIFKQPLGGHDDSPIETDATIGSAAAPAGLHFANLDCIHVYTKPFRKVVDGRPNLMNCPSTIPFN